MRSRRWNLKKNVPECGSSQGVFVEPQEGIKELDPPVSSTGQAYQVRDDKEGEGLLFSAILAPEHVGEDSKNYGCERTRP